MTGNIFIHSHSYKVAWCTQSLKLNTKLILFNIREIKERKTAKLTFKVLVDLFVPASVSFCMVHDQWLMPHLQLIHHCFRLPNMPSSFIDDDVQPWLIRDQRWTLPWGLLCLIRKYWAPQGVRERQIFSSLRSAR